MTRGPDFGRAAMSDTRWKGAPAGMGYGFAFNDHLQAMTAAAKAKMGIADEATPQAQAKPQAASAPSGKEERRPSKP